MSTKSSAEVRRVGRFGLVGILNTLVDYTIFIGLTKIFSLPLDRVWVAKIPSGAVAMLFSFAMNRAWVFKAKNADVGKQAAQFFPVTLVGVFVIQLGLVQLFSSVFPQIGQLGFTIIDAIGLTNLLPTLLTEPFVIKTAAFGLATIGSLTWNYVMYKRVVFRR